MKKWIVLLLLGTATAGAWYYFKNGKDAAPQYQTEKIRRGEIIQAVTATGTLKPVVNVQVGSQISGNIQKLHADFNSTVKKGQVVAQLDPATFQAVVNQVEGELASAQAALELAKLNAKRQRELAANKISTQADLDQAEAALRQAEATVKIRSAQLEKARVDLSRCTIYAPIDGIVISRNVDVGQTVAASLQAPVIFQIANDLRNMQIDANVAEADVGSVEVGQRVEFTVDAFENRTFQGEVSQVRNEPITVQNVVTYVTVISVTNEDLKLKPGMTANVSIISAQKNDVVKLSNSALRVRLPDADGSGSPARRPEGAGPPGVGTSGGSGQAATPGPSAEAPQPAAEGGRSGRRRERRGGPSGGRSRGERGGATQRTVYKMVNGKPEAARVRLGITDSIYTEVLEGLQEGDEIITGTMTPQPENAPRGGSSPFGGGGRRRF